MNDEQPPDTDQPRDGAEAGDPPADSLLWPGLPDVVADEDLVASKPAGEPPPDERQPPPETIWGAL